MGGGRGTESLMRDVYMLYLAVIGHKRHNHSSGMNISGGYAVYL
jgi:hypothetical protein